MEYQTIKTARIAKCLFGLGAFAFAVSTFFTDRSQIVSAIVLFLALSFDAQRRIEILLLEEKITKIKGEM